MSFHEDPNPSHSTRSSRRRHRPRSRLARCLRAPGLFAVGLGLCTALATSASASTLPTVTTRDRIVQSDLVFEGVVLSVEHRLAQVSSPDQVAIPHTFVTLSIARSFKGGSTAGDRITLRFRGGPDGKGRVLRVPGIPQFRSGDREILFVRDNGADICPLVGWEQSRLRVIRGEIYDEQGREVWLAPSGDFVFGEVAIDVDDDAYRPLVAEAAASAPGEQGHESFVPPAGSRKPDAAGFDLLLEQAVISMASQGDLGKPALATSLNVDAPFSVDPQLAVDAPAIPGTRTGPLFRGEFDPREAALLRQAMKRRGN